MKALNFLQEVQLRTCYWSLLGLGRPSGLNPCETLLPLVTHQEDTRERVLSSPRPTSASTLEPVFSGPLSG